MRPIRRTLLCACAATLPLVLVACGHRTSDALPAATPPSVDASPGSTPPADSDDAAVRPDAAAPLDASSLGDASGAPPDDATLPYDASADGSGDDAADATEVVSDAASPPDSGPSSSDASHFCLPLPAGLVTLAANQAGPYTLVAAGGAIYWTNLGGAIMRASPDGCSTTALTADQTNAVGMAVGDASIYFTAGGQGGSDGGLFEVPLDGGTPVPLAAGLADPYMVAAYGEAVYFTSDVQGPGSIWAWSGGVAAPFALNQNYPGGLVAIASGVYWGTYDGTVNHALLDAGSLPPIASGETTPRFFASDGTNVFWADTDDGLVLQMNPDGGAPIPLNAAGTLPYGVATDGINVYWTTLGVSGSSTPNGAVYRGPIGGGSPPTKLVEGSGASMGLVAVDATSVYWIEGSAVQKFTPK